MSSISELRQSLRVSDEEFARWQVESQPKPYLRSLNARELLSVPPPPVPWIVEPLCARGAVTLLTGREGEGKSMLALAIAAAALTGETVADLRGTQTEVLYVDAENGERVIAERLHLLGVDPAIKLAVAEGFSLSKHLDLLEDQVIALEPGLVVLDSLRSLWPGGDENDSGSVERLLAQLRGLARRRNTAVLSLHHLNKQGNSPYRGTTALGAGCEFVVTMRQDRDDSAVRILEWYKCRLRQTPRPMWLRFISTGARLHIETNVGVWESWY